MGDPVAIMGVVSKGIDPFGKPVPCINPMLEQELPEAYYQLLKMTESERQTLLSVQVYIASTYVYQSHPIPSHTYSHTHPFSRILLCHVISQGKMIITGDMQSLEPPFIGCACFSEWEPCGGCTPNGCSKLC